MQQKATVTKILPDNMAEIEVVRPTACGHDCSKCNGCETVVAQRIRVVARNPLAAAPGAQVMIEGENKKVFGAAAIVYLIPFALFFIAYGIARAALLLSEGGAAICGMAGFAIGMLGALGYNKRMQAAGAVTFVIKSYVDTE